MLIARKNQANLKSTHSIEPNLKATYKTVLAIVLLALLICFAGCTSVKSSSEGCPGNNKMRHQQGYSSRCFKF